MTVIGSAGVELYADDTRLPQSIDAAVQRALGRLPGDFDEAGRESGRRFETALSRVLTGLQADVDVRADTARAEAQLGQLDSVVPPVEVQVDADTTQAESALDEFVGGVQDGMADAGDEGGAGFVGGFSDQLGALSSKTGPIVGSVIGAVSAIVALSPGVIIWNAIMDGLEQESRRGLFQAQTGLDAETAARFGRAAGEAYADNFGASIEDNLETARVALGSGLLDGDATQAEIEGVIGQLDTLALVLRTDTSEAARGVGSLLRNGLARDAQQAFDVITRGAQITQDVAGDLIDTVSEYGSTFSALGLDGAAAIGLLSQGLKAGAPNADFLADALRETGIIAREMGEDAAAAYETLGLSAEQIQDQFAAGGDSAAAALDQLFDALRRVEDPAAQNALAVKTIGTTFEDLQGVITAMDPSQAVEFLGEIEGASTRASSAIGDNAAGALEEAQRNIEVASTGIQQALAAAFAPQIEGGADWISQNREEIVQFLLDAAEGALDLGIGLAQASATGVRTFGELAGVAGDFALQLALVLDGLSDLPGIDFSNTVDSLAASALGLNAIQEGSNAAADGIEDRLIPTLEETRARLSDVGIDAVQQAAFSDATNVLATSLAGLGAGVEASQVQFADLNGEVFATTDAGRTLVGQLADSAAALREQVDAGVAAGQSQSDLQAQYDATRGQLIDQAAAFGLTREQAGRLVNQLGLIPEDVTSTITTNADEQTGKVATLKRSIDALTGEVHTVRFEYREYGRPSTLVGRGSDIGLAGGGWVDGPGTGTSDSAIFDGPDGRVRLSRGEYVVNAEDAARHRFLLEDLNAGKPVEPVVIATGGGPQPLVFSPTIHAPPGADPYDQVRLLFNELAYVGIGGSTEGPR